MIGIINYGSGNIRAIGNIYDRLHIEYTVIESDEQLETADKLILPGVGAFDSTMNALQQAGLVDKLNEMILDRHVPILGICVGMQILCNRSEEGQCPGLGWIDAEVKRLDPSRLPSKPKLPHMGWNQVFDIKHNQLFDGIDKKEGFYFVHSYYVECKDASDIMTKTLYGINFASSVHRDNIFGVQFHPEKSHENGILLLKNFALL